MLWCDLCHSYNVTDVFHWFSLGTLFLVTPMTTTDGPSVQRTTKIGTWKTELESPWEPPDDYYSSYFIVVFEKKVRWSWSSLLNSQKLYDLRAIIHSFFNSIPIPQISPDVSHKSWITIWKMSQRISTALWNLSLQKYTHLSASFALNFPLPVLSSTSFCTSFALNFSLTVHDLELHLHSNLNNDAYLALNMHSTLHSSCTPFCLFNSKMYFTVTFSSVPLNSYTLKSFSIVFCRLLSIIVVHQ